MTMSCVFWNCRQEGEKKSLESAAGNVETEENEYLQDLRDLHPGDTGDKLKQDAAAEADFNDNPKVYSGITVFVQTL